MVSKKAKRSCSCLLESQSGATARHNSNHTSGQPDASAFSGDRQHEPSDTITTRYATILTHVVINKIPRSIAHQKTKRPYFRSISRFCYRFTFEIVYSFLRE